MIDIWCMKKKILNCWLHSTFEEFLYNCKIPTPLLYLLFSEKHLSNGFYPFEKEEKRKVIRTSTGGD